MQNLLTLVTGIAKVLLHYEIRRFYIFEDVFFGTVMLPRDLLRVLKLHFLTPLAES